LQDNSIAAGERAVEDESGGRALGRAETQGAAESHRAIEAFQLPIEDGKSLGSEHDQPLVSATRFGWIQVAIEVSCKDIYFSSNCSIRNGLSSDGNNNEKDQVDREHADCEVVVERVAFANAFACKHAVLLVALDADVALLAVHHVCSGIVMDLANLNIIH
jgi:hypothetical protein